MRGKGVLPGILQQCIGKQIGGGERSMASKSIWSRHEHRLRTPKASSTEAGPSELGMAVGNETDCLTGSRNNGTLMESWQTHLQEPPASGEAGLPPATWLRHPSLSSCVAAWRTHAAAVANRLIPQHSSHQAAEYSTGGKRPAFSSLNRNCVRHAGKSAVSFGCFGPRRSPATQPPKRPARPLHFHLLSGTGTC